MFMRVRYGKCAFWPLMLGAALLAGCGGGRTVGESGGSGFGGVVETTRFEIAAGETRTVSRDLVVKASEDIVIAGTLRIEPGVDVLLYAQGALTIDGRIEAAPARGGVSRRRQSGGDGPKLVMGSNRTDLGEGGFVSAETDVFVFAAGSRARITLRGYCSANDAPDATGRGEPGQDGNDMEIGTDRTVAEMGRRGLEAFRPVSVTLAYTGSDSPLVRAAHGGDGFHDDTGIRTGRDVALEGTPGGAGGSVSIAAETIELQGGSLLAGQGGAGGRAGAPAGVRAQDAVGLGEAGGRVVARGGSGGAGGSVFLTGTVTGSGTQARPGYGGHAGAVTAASGNGGPGGDGGAMTITLGRGGLKGTGERNYPPAEDGKPAVVTIQGGGHGGDSEEPERPGGQGAQVAMTTPEPVSPALDAASRIADFGDGGDGFNGCFMKPMRNGTVGGKGGTITTPSGEAIRLESGLNGGDGGDGMPLQGERGFGGVINAGKQGQDGVRGGPCLFSPTTVAGDGYLAVILDYDLGTDLLAGDIVPLCRIRGARPAGPEPITATTGCDSDHLHAEGGAIFVRIVIDGARSSLIGPFGDREPMRCGYGKLTVTPTCEIITRAR